MAVCNDDDDDVMMWWCDDDEPNAWQQWMEENKLYHAYKQWSNETNGKEQTKEEKKRN